MNIVENFWLATVTTTIVNLLLVIFVANNPIDKVLKRRFVIYAATIAWWSGWLFASSYVSNSRLAYIFCQMLHAGSMFIPVFFIHFLYEFFGLLKKKSSWALRVNYAIALSFFAVDLFAPSLLFSSVGPKLGFPNYVSAAPLYAIWMIFFFGQVIYGHVLLYVEDVRATGIRKKQLQFFFIANLLGYLGGVGAFLSVYDYVFFPFPYGNYGVVLFSVVTAYTIVKYKFFNIEVIIKKTLVFTGLFVMIMTVVTGVSALMQEYVSRLFSVSPTVSTLISVTIAITLYDAVRTFLVNSTDKFLFQKKDDIKIMLNKLSRNVITILDLDKLAQTILVALQTTMRVGSGAIIIKDEDEGTYRILDAFGIKNKESHYDKEGAFIEFCKANNRVINLESEQQKSVLSEDLFNKFSDLNAAVVMPLFIGTDLTGILILGKKRSDQEFANDELDYFPTVASQVAVALSNARLYDILKKSQINFAQQAKMAAIGTLSAGISHEIKNPLNHIKVGIAMLRMNKKHGLMDKMERYKMEEEVFKTLDILDENVQRANEVIERLSSFAKKPKEQTVEAVDLRKAAEMALSFVRNDLEYNSIDIELNFPADFPSIHADVHTMEDTILNLVVNARHAIGNHGKIKLAGVVSSGEIDFQVSDTGAGIPTESLERIFDPFFTTKDVSRNPDKNAVKGSGLGLFIVREFIQRSGGSVYVESQVGKGTTFHLIFPKKTWAVSKLGLAG